MKSKNLPDHCRKWALGSSTKVRNEFSDYDYVDKLDRESLQWLKAFHREYLNADFRHKDKKLHKDKAHIKNIYDMNNSRNRDLYNIVNVSGNLFFGWDVAYKHHRADWDHENRLMEKIDERQAK